MGYELRREVRDSLPFGLLTSSERLVLLELADNANDKTRKAYPGRVSLAPLTGLTERSLKDALMQVFKKWIDIRVIRSFDKKGAPVYAHKGKTAEYVFPHDLPAAYLDAVEARSKIGAFSVVLDSKGSDFSSPTNEGDPEADPTDGQRGPETRDEGVRIPVAKGSEIPSEGVGNPDPLFLRVSQDPSNLSSGPALADDAAAGLEDRERLVPELKDNPEVNTERIAAYEELAKLGADQAEADVLYPLLRKAAKVLPDGPGWWRHLGGNGDLARKVAELRRGFAKEAEKRIADEAAAVLEREERARERQQDRSSAGPTSEAREIMQRLAEERQAKAAAAKVEEDRRRAQLDQLLAEHLAAEQARVQTEVPA